MNNLKHTAMKLHVMVPLDFSETALTALKSGIAIANKLDANLRIVYVQPKNNYASGYEWTGDRDQKNETQQMLDKIIRDYNSQYFVKDGVFDYKIRTGNIVQELINQGKYDDVTLIVAGSHGVSGITESWIGGNAYKLICNAPCPILVIRQGMEIKDIYQRIAITINSTKSSRYKVPVVAGLAKKLGAKTSLIGIQRSGIEFIFRRISLAIRQVSQYLRSKAGLEVESTRIVQGADANAQFIEALRETKADMVAIDVMNTGAFFTDRFRPFLTSLINNSNCPVLVVPTKE